MRMARTGKSFKKGTLRGKMTVTDRAKKKSVKKKMKMSQRRMIAWTGRSTGLILKMVKCRLMISSTS